MRIIWIHPPIEGDNEPDIDNIVKDILDALKDVVFANDRAVVQCYAEKIVNPPGATLSIFDSNLPSHNVYEDLIELLSNPDEDVLYIEVGPVTTQQMAFGPVS